MQDNVKQWEKLTQSEWKKTPFKNTIIKEYNNKIEDLKTLKYNEKYFQLLKKHQIKYNAKQWSISKHERDKVLKSLSYLKFNEKNIDTKLIKSEIERLTTIKNKI